MVALGSLWIPIVLAAVIVFAAQSFMHAVLKYHNRQWRKVADTNGLQDALRKLSVVEPGQYFFPHAEPREMKDPEVVKKYQSGPVGVLFLMKLGVPAMGKLMAYMFLFNLVVTFFAAYLASRTLGPGAEYLAVFRVVGTAAFMGYGLGIFQQAIWYGRSWKDSWITALDGLIYGLLTAGVFGWLWPG